MYWEVGNMEQRARCQQPIHRTQQLLTDIIAAVSLRQRTLSALAERVCSQWRSEFHVSYSVQEKTFRKTRSWEEKKRADPMVTFLFTSLFQSIILMCKCWRPSKHIGTRVTTAWNKKSKTTLFKNVSACQPPSLGNGCRQKVKRLT